MNLTKADITFLKENKELLALVDTGKAVESASATEEQKSVDMEGAADNQKMEPKEKKIEIKFNENLYSAIQKMIIWM